MVRNAKLVGQSIISYLQKKGYPEVGNFPTVAVSILKWSVSSFDIQELPILTHPW